MMERVIATFRTKRDSERIADGEHLLVEHSGTETVVRKVPAIESKGPISSFAELAASFAAAAKRKR